MFRPTIPLQKRLELRLRGFRGPSVRILRQELGKVKRTAKTISFTGPDGIRYRNQSTPLIPSWKWQYRQCLRRPSARQWRRCLSSPTSPLPKPSWRWAHSIYSFNDKYLQSLIPATPISKEAMGAYLNMTPRGASDAHSATGLNSELRAIVSDRLRSQPPISQSLLGKISRDPRSFWRPFRDMCQWEPAILFKHRLAGRVDILMCVHDQRLEFLRRELDILRGQISTFLN
jgi:hypothetical protein